MNKNDYVIVLTTVGSETEANSLAETVVAEKLAACVLVQAGITSHYVWQGKKETAQEVTLLLKTLADKVPAIEMRFKTLHPYETPALIVLPAAYVSPAYAQWIDASLT